MSKQSTNVLIRDETWGWIPAVQRGTDKGKATVDVWKYPDEQSIACDNGKAAKGKFDTLQIDLKTYDAGVLPLQNVDNNGNLLEVCDMVKLPYLHEVCSFHSIFQNFLLTKILSQIDVFSNLFPLSFLRFSIMTRLESCLI